MAGFAISAHAHYATAPIFDFSKTIVITGIVKSISWRNPHGVIEMHMEEYDTVRYVQPQSDHIRTTERFIPNEDYSRPDYRITVTDPVMFTEPFDLTRYFYWRPGAQVHPCECLEMNH